MLNPNNMLLRYRQSATSDHSGISQFSARAKTTQISRKATKFFSGTKKKFTFFHVESAVLRFSEISVDMGAIIYCRCLGSCAGRVRFGFGLGPRMALKIKADEPGEFE